MTGTQASTITVRPGEWMERGACRDADDTLFFHPEGERGIDRVRRAAEAKVICADCKVRDLCLQYARGAREPYGVWGGESEDERKAVLSGKPIQTKTLTLKPVKLADTRDRHTLQPAVVIGHLNALIKEGFTPWAIARVADLEPNTVRKVLKGEGSKIYPATVEKLLSVQVQEVAA